MNSHLFKMATGLHLRGRPFKASERVAKRQKLAAGFGVGYRFLNEKIFSNMATTHSLWWWLLGRRAIGGGV